MKIFDPESGGVIRSLIAIVSSTLGAAFAVADVATEVWAQITLIVLASIVTVVQVLTHGTEVGNLPPGG